jgi:5-(carboxyamino)imidazole ribonucleotide synthase
VLAVEIFVVQGNGGPKVLVKEIAPRVHNSGHWTVDCARRSRSSSRISLPSPASRRRDINSYEQWLTVPGATDSGRHDPAKNA